jgi:hypothetical protein
MDGTLSHLCNLSAPTGDSRYSPEGKGAAAFDASIFAIFGLFLLRMR